MGNWTNKPLTSQEKAGLENYVKQRFTLESVRTDAEFDLTGDFLYVENASSPTALALVRLHERNDEQLELRLHTRIHTTFRKVFLTNTAQAGEWLDIIVGVDFEKKDEAFSVVQPAIRFVCTNAGQVYQLPDVPCKRVLIREGSVCENRSLNINFNAEPTANSFFVLWPGESLSVNVSNLNKIYLKAIYNETIAFVVYEH